MQSHLVRGAERVPRGSTRWLLLHLVREVRDPHWSAADAAHHLLGWVGVDLELLQLARARLVVLGPVGERPSRTHDRALSTLDLAIQELSLTQAGLEGGRIPGGQPTVPRPRTPSAAAPRTKQPATPPPIDLGRYRATRA